MSVVSNKNGFITFSNVGELILVRICGLSITAVLLQSLSFMRLNRAQARGAVNEGTPGFRYTY
jgi:hypothetical protein